MNATFLLYLVVQPVVDAARLVLVDVQRVLASLRCEQAAAPLLTLHVDGDSPQQLDVAVLGSGVGTRVLQRAFHRVDQKRVLLFNVLQGFLVLGRLPRGSLRVDCLIRRVQI